MICSATTMSAGLILARDFMLPWIVECLSAAITQRHTEADGPICEGTVRSQRTAWSILFKVQ
jgi:hypothetical protein